MNVMFFGDKFTSQEHVKTKATAEIVHFNLQ